MRRRRTTIRATVLGSAVALLLGGLTAASAPARAMELCFDLSPTIVGTEGRDIIEGTAGDDVIVGLGGDDEIRGHGGNDAICAGDGEDEAFGDAGAGVIVIGLAGDDRVDGGAGQTLCTAAPETTLMWAPLSRRTGATTC
jgi:Ca2+-binding RTX toxin-like protein